MSVQNQLSQLLMKMQPLAGTLTPEERRKLNEIQQSLASLPPGALTNPAKLAHALSHHLNDPVGRKLLQRLQQL